MNILFPFRRTTLSLAAFAIAAVFSLQVHAAPQILAVAATDVPQPLHCEDGVCAAEFSAFCLQKQRSNPRPGTVYHPVSEQSFVLIYDDENGTRHRVDGTELIHFTSNRGFTSVLAEVDQKALRELGAANATLEVTGTAPLVPEPEAGDSDPITADEVALAMTTLQPLADQWLGGAEEKIQTVRLINTIINQTPRDGRLSEDQREGLWDVAAQHTGEHSGQYTGTFASADGTGLKEEAVARAREMHDACLWRVEVGRYFTMRSCLNVKHDSLLQDMNLSYWKATEVGS